MKTDHWQQIDRLLEAALDHPVNERAAFLAVACGSDEALRLEVEALLQADANAASLIDGPAMTVAAEMLIEEQARSLRAQVPEQYRVLKQLGAGGMGEVWLAEDTRLGRKVALKLLPARYTRDAERIRRFEQEGRAASALNHPNILTIYELGQTAHSVYIAAEYIEGQTLRQLLAAGPLKLSLARDIARQIAAALAAAHAVGIIHRDIKPENVMLRADGLVKVLDFGLAKLSNDRALAAAEKLTASGMVLGTAGYMSPEQVRGEEADKRSDIFSCGAIFYELLSGQRAFAGASAIEVMNAILKEEPPDLDGTGKSGALAFEKILRRCLSKRPEQRFQSASDLGFALETLSAISASGSGDTPAPDINAASSAVLSAAFLVRRARLAWLSAGLLTSAVVALAMFWLLRPGPATGVFYAALSLPEHTNATLYGGIALAPDGQHAVAVAATDGVSRLWLYSFAKPGSVLLPGTEGARYPFWSPNSRQIGFFAQGQLKKIEVASGQPQTLCEAPQGYGGTWNEAGVILFAPDTTGVGLYQVAETGGTATPVTQLDKARAELGHWHPSFLPDGRHFLFFAYAGQPAQRGIRIGSLTGEVTSFFLSANAKAVYSTAGCLLFVRGRKIVAQPFDIEKLALRGEPAVVSEQVEFDPTTCQVELAVYRDDILLYRSGGNLTGQLVWVNRQGAQLGAVGPPAEYRYLRLAPDGTKVLLERNDPEVETNDVWQLDLQRETLTRLTFNPASDWCPLWSPDMQRIIFTSLKDGAHRIYQKGLGSAEFEELLYPGDQRVLLTSDWSRDGRSVIFRNDGEKTGRDIAVLSVANDRAVSHYLATPFDEYWASLSPDGRWLAYQSTESGRYEIYVQSFPTPGQKITISKAGGTFPRWRGDGRELYYVAADDKLMAVPVQIGASLTTGAPVALFELGSLGRRNNRYVYDVSANGQRFLLIRPQENVSARPLTLVRNWTALMRQ